MYKVIIAAICLIILSYVLHATYDPCITESGKLNQSCIAIDGKYVLPPGK